MLAAYADEAANECLLLMVRQVIPHYGFFTQNTMPLCRLGLFFHNLWETYGPPDLSPERDRFPKGGGIHGDVYAAGMNDQVGGSTSIVMTGDSATVTGALHGGSNIKPALLFLPAEALEREKA